MDRTPTTRTASGRRGSPRASAFTLMEAAISTGIVTLIFGATASMMLLAHRQVAAAGAEAEVTLPAQLLAQQIASELTVATSITEQTQKALTFTVPDRNNDGQPETIRYAWSGTPGDPLTRQYNNGAAVIVAANVRSFDLSYLTRTLHGTPAPQDETPPSGP